ncbi:MAG: DUF2345 domain-containing protein [Chitinophaga sp.]|uniref:type VI secretion system Vgr family protein n=1 Tax=Chitinophaga sp. TaxID=1869181 RepID=UPI001B2679DD|nr:phage baseplate assembly protein V [Chitinophaga sp.]MBO9729203.1 DUF2345 domain-containing protein [Chitinophaga sp.]
MTIFTKTTVSVGKQQFEQFQFLHLKQSMTAHHEFELGIGYDWISRQGANPIMAGKNLLGKEINICIQPIESTLHYKPLSFNGIITNVSAGKERDGITGSCILRGNSPTILLAGNPHTQSFEEQTLSTIVHTVFKNSYPMPVTPYINPVIIHPLKYIVQYKETGFDFLHRLSERYGEPFFYNGQQIIFGQYTPQRTPLIHQEDLTDFRLECKILPGKQLLNAYEYRLQQFLEEESGKHSFDTCNTHSQQAYDLSNKFFSQPGYYKIPFAISGNASAELAVLARQYQQSRLSQMIFMKGRSCNTSLQPGNIINIREKWTSHEDHGEFVLTTLEHHCNGNGNYYNTFEGVPADVVTPSMHLHNTPYCEAQSAIVTDNCDPKGLGRIRVRFQWQTGSTPWIRLHQPHGGPDKGFYFIPEINEEVWVHFEGGNPEAPYATGCASNGNERTNYGDDMNNVKVIKTRSGHTIRLDDTSQEEHIIISDKGGNTILMDTHGQNISLSAPENIKITARNISIYALENIDVQAGFHMTHTAGQNMTQTAGDCLSQYTVNDYRLTATNITKTALENINIQAREIEKNAAAITVTSTKEDMLLQAEKTINIQSSEKSKIF